MNKNKNINNKNFFKQCEDANVSYKDYTNFRRKIRRSTGIFPSVEDYILYESLPKKKTIKELCFENGLNYKLFQSFKERHSTKEHTATIDDYIEYLNKQEGINLKKRECAEKNVNYYAYKKYQSDEAIKGNVVNVDDYIKYKNKHTKSLKAQCQEKGISYLRYKEYRNQFGNNLSVEDFIKYLKKQDRNNNTLREKCYKKDISYKNFRDYIQKQGKKADEITTDDFDNFIALKRLRENSISQRCRVLNVDRRRFYKYKKEHPNITPEQFFNLFGSKKATKGFAIKCEEIGVNYDDFILWRSYMKCTYGIKLKPQNYKEYLEHFVPNKTINLCRKLEIENLYDYYLRYKKRIPDLTPEEFKEKYYFRIRSKDIMKT